MLPADPSPWAAFLASFFLAVTHLGSGLGVVLMTLVYGWWVDPPGGRRLGLTLGVSFLVNLGLKELFGLPRPFDLTPEAVSPEARSTATGPGFPSGHTQSATAFWLFLALRWRRRRLYATAAVMIVLVGASRLYLGVHFPLDVAGGWIAGVAVACLGVWGPEARSPRPAVGALLGAAGLGMAWFVGGQLAQVLGLGLGVLLSRGDYEAARTRVRRVLVAAGGLLVLGSLYVGLDWAFAEAVAAAGVQEGGTSAALYLRSLIVAFVTFDLWPRRVLGVWSEEAVGEG